VTVVEEEELIVRPTETLVEEHKLIGQVLDCLQKMCEGLERGERLDPDVARDVIYFLRHFADRCHHAKEEDHLFRLLEASGIAVDGGPVGVMLMEHEEGRELVGGMERAVEALSRDPVGAPTAFVQHGVEYVVLLRGHIQKENHCLFPLADHKLAAEHQRELETAFGAQGEKDRERGVLEKCLGIAEALAERYGVEKVQVRLG